MAWQHSLLTSVSQLSNLALYGNLVIYTCEPMKKCFRNLTPNEKAAGKNLKEFEILPNVNFGNVTQQHINFQSNENAYMQGLLITRF